jgi:hypothetical protein
VDTINPETTGRRSPTKKLPVGKFLERSGKKLPARKVLERYDIVDRTLDRWLADPKLGFPRPAYINKRRYFDEGELDAFDASKVEA